MSLDKDTKQNDTPEKNRKKTFYARALILSKSILMSQLILVLSVCLCLNWGIWIDLLSARLADLIPTKAERLCSSVFWQHTYSDKIYHLQKRGHGYGQLRVSRMKAVCNWTLWYEVAYTMKYWTGRHPVNAVSSRQLGSKWLLKNAGDLELTKLEYPQRKDRAVKCLTRHRKAEIQW